MHCAGMAAHGLADNVVDAGIGLPKASESQLEALSDGLRSAVLRRCAHTRSPITSHDLDPQWQRTV